jgi:hypothetical protein
MFWNNGDLIGCLLRIDFTVIHRLALTSHTLACIVSKLKNKLIVYWLINETKSDNTYKITYSKLPNDKRHGMYNFDSANSILFYTRIPYVFGRKKGWGISKSHLSTTSTDINHILYDDTITHRITYQYVNNILTTINVFYNSNNKLDFIVTLHIANMKAVSIKISFGSKILDDLPANLDYSTIYNWIHDS